MIEIDYVLLPLVLAVALTLQFRMVQRELRSIFDPMLYFVVATSFALTFSFLYLQDWGLIARITLYFAVFWVGYRLVMLTAPTSVHFPISTPLTSAQERGFAILCLVVTGVYVLANLFAWSLSGIPLLSSDPSLQKVESLTGGLGVVRRLNWGVGVFATLGALYWFLRTRKAIAIACLGAAAAVAILGGGKSALLTVLFGLGLYIHRPFLDIEGKEWSQWLRRKSLILIAAGVVPVALVLAIEATDDANAFNALMIRLLYFGDSLIYWSRPELRDHFSGIYTAFSYGLHLLNPVLGFLRLATYENPIGNEFVQYSLRAGEELSGSLGPNTPFYVKGELFFGPWLAPAYTLMMGAWFASFRRGFVAMKNASLTRYTFQASLVVIGMTIPTEDALFVGRLFDLVLLLAPLYVASRVIYWGTIARAKNVIAA